MMIRRISFLLTATLIGAFALHAQQSWNVPFSKFEKAVASEPGGWSGNKERLSSEFVAERNRLEDRFESELLKWLANDPEKHYWISVFLEDEGYLHGSKRLPYFSLLLKQQGLALVRDRDDEESRRYVVGLTITAAILSSELDFRELASSYKTEAEGLLRRQPELETSIPGMTEADRQRYDKIASAVSSKVPTVVSDNNPPPKAPVSGGVLNGRAMNLVKPAYSAEAHKAGASGTVEVKIVIDEMGKVIWARAISGHPLLRQSAEDAAWRTTFPPTKLSGQPVKVSGLLLYNFLMRFP